MDPIFFSNTAEFRKWLEENHQSASEVLIGYYKVKTGKPSMNWSDSVDEALCYGWIDGVRRSIDEQSYYNRFTPRRSKSNWSRVNIEKVERLIAQGRMQPAGLAAFEKRAQARSEIYSYENPPDQLSGELEAIFKQHPQAWEFFLSQAPSYKKTRIYWVMSAKQKTTQLSRLTKLIAASENATRLF
ncbi:MAG: YdeI/OmpD-associated family protein [Bacteroidales bacterium]